MTGYSTSQIWIIIIVMGIATFLIRFSFLGLIGGGKMPDWLLRHLRYTPVAVLPGLVAPLVVWPEATSGVPDLSYIAAALVTLAVGRKTQNLLWGAGTGALTLGLLQQVL